MNYRWIKSQMNALHVSRVGRGNYVIHILHKLLVINIRNLRNSEKVFLQNILHGVISCNNKKNVYLKVLSLENSNYNALSSQYQNNKLHIPIIGVINKIKGLPVNDTMSSAVY